VRLVRISSLVATLMASESLSRIAALAEALLAQTDSAVQAAMTENLLSALEEDLPGATRLCATVLSALGGTDGREIGGAFLKRVDPEKVNQLAVAPADARSVDLIVVAVKPVELAACLTVFGIRELQLPTVLGASGLCGWFVNIADRRTLITMVGGAGNVQTATAMSSLREMVRSPSAILVGMAAGVEGTVNLGDVVVAEAILEYEFARLTQRGAFYQPRAYNVAENLIASAEALPGLVGQWTALCRQIVREASRPPQEPQLTDSALDRWFPDVKRGVILAGAKLFEDGSLPRLKGRVHDRVRAAEMEGAGFASHCTRTGMHWLVVRGVADFGKRNRSKEWQFAATVAAALFVREYVRRRFFG
jgi:nucleoside phosphorylase